MFVILLAQFNSLYNTVLVLLAVVLSFAGVMIGMLVMKQPFSIIMTGTGVLALAGIVVNNNIILIDTYQQFSRTMPPLEAIVRTAEQRLRPVFLTTFTTMVGLAPMMVAASIRFGAIPDGLAALWSAGLFSAEGWRALHAATVEYGAPAALWWTQLATAVFFGLGIATVLTLVVTPALLALRIWFWVGVDRLAAGVGLGSGARARALARAARRAPAGEILWEEPAPEPPPLRLARPPYADAAE
jgi:multidrug efflux pump